MSRLATQQFFNEYFGHNPPTARNCIDQAYDRLKRTLPDDIIDVRHTKDWAVGGKSQTRSFVAIKSRLARRTRTSSKKRKIVDLRSGSPEETNSEEDEASPQVTCSWILV